MVQIKADIDTACDILSQHTLTVDILFSQLENTARSNRTEQLQPAAHFSKHPSGNGVGGWCLL